MKRTVCLGLAALFFAAQARGQEITEEQFLAPFTGSHAAVRSLEGDLSASQAALRRASTIANPRLEIAQERPEENPRQTTWSLAWTPPLDGRFGLGRKAGEAGQSAAQHRLVAETARQRADIRSAFADWSLAAERLGVFERQARLVGGLAEQAREQARVGEESGLLARRLWIAGAEARSMARLGEAGYARAEAGARAWRSDLPADARPARVDLPELPSGIEASAAPAVLASRHEVEQADLEHRRQRRFLGFPELQIGWQELEDVGSSGASVGGPVFGLGWSIPLFDRAQANRAEAGRRIRISEAQLQLATARAEADIAGGAAEYIALVAAAREAEQGTQEVERVIEAAVAAYRAGEATLTDLLETLRSAFGAHLHAIEVRRAALDAHRRLETAVARPLRLGETP